MTFTEMTDIYRSIGKSKKCTFIFCADHGVAKMNVSAYPQSTTAGMVKNYLVDKGAAANAFANFARSDLVVVDVGVNADVSKLPNIVNRKIAEGTNNIAEGPAMTFAQAKRAIKIGKDLVNKAVKAGYNCFLIGEMGIANTTVASTIAATMLDVGIRKVTGRGSNISDERLEHKIKVIRKAMAVNDPLPDDPIDVLMKVGGFEFGAMMGVILAAVEHEKIVILDGFNTAVAALLADFTNPAVGNYLIASHLGREIGHRKVLEYLGLTPMFTLDLALGEAIGSSIAARILDSLVYVFVCDSEDDFDGDLSDFKDNDNEEAIVSNLLEKIGLGEMTQITTLDDLENYLEKNFDGDVHVEEVDLDFQLSDDQRLESFEAPFSAQDFNIPRSYPMMIREMVNEIEDAVAATDRTFNFYLQTMPKLDLKAMDKCREYIDNLTKPRRSLGLLEDIAVQIAGITSYEKPANNLRHAALAFTNSENSPGVTTNSYKLKKGQRHNVSMDFSMTVRTFAMKIFMGVVDSKQDPTVAFNFGRNLAEEISFGIPIIALTELTDWRLDKIDEKFARALLTKDGEFKVAPEDFMNNVPQNFRCLTSALIGAMIAAAHNSTFIVVDCGAVDIIARYLEKICPQIRPFILHATDLINFDFAPGQRIGFDGEMACIGVEIVEAALTALNEMKTFSDAGVDVAIDGAGKGVQIK